MAKFVSVRCEVDVRNLFWLNIYYHAHSTLLKGVCVISIAQILRVTPPLWNICLFSFFFFFS